jgi:hypothetical protein
VRPALSGRLLVSALAIAPIGDLLINPNQIAADIVVSVVCAFFAIYLWRLHIYADADVVAYRGGARSFEAKRTDIVAMALSRPLPLNCAFLGANDAVLLSVPIAGVLPRRDLLRLAQYLHVPVRGVTSAS